MMILIVVLFRCAVCQRKLSTLAFIVIIISCSQLLEQAILPHQPQPWCYWARRCCTLRSRCPTGSCWATCFTWCLWAATPAERVKVCSLATRCASATSLSRTRCPSWTASTQNGRGLGHVTHFEILGPPVYLWNSYKQKLQSLACELNTPSRSTSHRIRNCA